jgi:transposase-like protein
MGRPTLYNPDKNILVQGWARDGLYDVQIAHNLGVTNETLRVWKKQYPAFSAAIKNGKEVTDRIAENSLFKRVHGYEYEETTIEYIDAETADAEGNKVIVPARKTKTVIKQIAPDVTAQIFWLCNRKTGVWQNVNKVDHTGDLSIVVKLPDTLRES